jgi:hypothetical protein
LLGESTFLDDLNCEELFGVLCDELIAACEPALAKEVALDVAGHGVGLEAVVLD